MNLEGLGDATVVVVGGGGALRLELGGIVDAIVDRVGPIPNFDIVFRMPFLGLGKSCGVDKEKLAAMIDGVVALFVDSILFVVVVVVVDEGEEEDDE